MQVNKDGHHVPADKQTEALYCLQIKGEKKLLFIVVQPQDEKIISHFVRIFIIIRSPKTASKIHKSTKYKKRKITGCVEVKQMVDRHTVSLMVLSDTLVISASANDYFHCGLI